MSPVHRPLDGDVLLFDMEQERNRLAGQPSGRQARTLLKSGPLRVIMIALGPDGTTAEHQAEGPITIQPLRGRIRFTAGARVHELGPGELLGAGAGIPHAVASDDGAVFLLTIGKSSP